MTFSPDKLKDWKTFFLPQSKAPKCTPGSTSLLIHPRINTSAVHLSSLSHCASQIKIIFSWKNSRQSQLWQGLSRAAEMWCALTAPQDSTQPCRSHNTVGVFDLGHLVSSLGTALNHLLKKKNAFSCNKPLVHPYFNINNSDIILFSLNCAFFCTNHKLLTLLTGTNTESETPGTTWEN